MRRLLQLCAVLLSACLAHAQYPLGPESQVKDVPHGTIEKAVLPPGQFFPGTPHNYAVYTPANAGSGPLPYIVFLDGSSYLGNGLRAPIVLDNLIAAKAIPPMIGIFVDPGVLPAIRPDAQNRYERVFEYDSLSNRYSQFLLTELLPAVGKKHALSTDPNEHAIAGTSTGAVGAFVAAWHRPDQFRRVLSLIGTYVAMKGADTLPEIVRKTEAKPIRIWMQDGANDHITPTEPYGTFFAGTWPRANGMLFDALQFEGYDAKLTIGTGGHDTKQGSAELPEALRWLWRDYAETGKVQPIVPHPPAALGDAGWMTRGSVWATVDAIDNWEEVKTGEYVPRSLGVFRNGDVMVAGETGVARLRGGVIEPLYKGVMAAAIGPADELYVSELDGGLAQKTGAIRKINLGKQGQVIASHVQPTSIVLNSAGLLFFTDTQASRVFALNTLIAGSAPTSTLTRAIKPAGLTLSPDGAMLAVTDLASRYQWSYQLNGSGRPSYGEPFYRLESEDADFGEGSFSAAFDSLGQVYFASEIGIQVCEANGRVAMILNNPDPGLKSGISALVFAGQQRDWLYATQDNRLFRRKMKTHGVSPDKPEKPPQPPL